MAIIIPSKSIYRQNNPKVRDNVVDKIEINCVNIQPNNTYAEPVANTTLLSEVAGSIYKEDKISNAIVDRYSSYEADYGYVLSAIFYERIYAKGRFVIPKHTGLGFISSLTPIKGEEIESPIQYKAYTTKKLGRITTNGSISKSLYVGGSSIKVSVEDFTIDYSHKETTIEKTERNHIAPVTIKLYENNVVLPLSTINATSKSKIEYKDDFSFINIKESEENIEINFSVACGLIVDKYGYTEQGNYIFGNGEIDETNTQNIVWTGTTEIYEPGSLVFTIYGNIIGISLEDKTLQYKTKNSVNNFSIDGNELTQTTNYYKTEDNLLLEKQADNILDAYQNGKETATIRCSIVDYYDENGDLAISTSGQNLLDANSYLWLSYATFEDGKITQSQADGSTATEFDFYLDGGTNLSNWDSVWLGAVYDVSNPQRVYITFKKEDTFSIIRFKYNGATRDTSVLYDVSHLKNGEYYTFSAYISDLTQGNISWEKMQITVGEEQLAYEPFIPMCFQQYDEVIPMDYAVVKGKTQDVPMSTYKDGTPKQFQVVSTNIEYDGSVMQTLKLQEILQKQQPIFSRVYIVEFLLDNYVYAKKTTVDGKVYELPDIPSISAGYYFDDWYTEPNGGGEKVTTDTTFTKDTKVYANVVEDMSYQVKVTFHDTVDGTVTLTTGYGGYLDNFPIAENRKYYNFAGYATLQDGKGVKVGTAYKFIEDTDVYPYYIEKSTSSLLDDVYTDIDRNTDEITNAYSQIDHFNTIVGDVNKTLNATLQNSNTIIGNINSMFDEIANLGDRIDNIEGGEEAREGFVYLNPNGGVIYINNTPQLPNAEGYVEAKITIYGEKDEGILSGVVTVYKEASDVYSYTHNGWVAESDGEVIAPKGKLAKGGYYFAQYEETEIKYFYITLTTDFGQFSNGENQLTIQAPYGTPTTINFADYPISNTPNGVRHIGWDDGTAVYGKDGTQTYNTDTTISAVFDISTGVYGGEDGIHIDEEVLEAYIGMGVGDVYCNGVPAFIGTGQLDAHNVSVSDKIQLFIPSKGVIYAQAGSIEVNSWDIVIVNGSLGVSKRGDGLVTSFFNRALQKKDKFSVTTHIADEMGNLSSEQTFSCVNTFPDDVEQ